jgi:hypothetical protein
VEVSHPPKQLPGSDAPDGLWIYGKDMYARMQRCNGLQVRCRADISNKKLFALCELMCSRIEKDARLRLSQLAG